MRALAVRRFGESPLIGDFPVPAAQDAVLIRVSHAGVNPVDYQLVDQLTASSSFPFVLGVDVAGVVEHVPAGNPVFASAIAFSAWPAPTGPTPSTPP